nr:AAA family ATPase [Acetobacter persici]
MVFSVRLFVTGPTGCGKSTLASELAHKASLPVFPLDEMHWVRQPEGDVRRDPAARLAMLDSVVQRDAWIVEGVQFKWADKAMEHATHIVILDIPRWKNNVQIFRRFLGRQCFPRNNSRGTLQALREELRWSADYYGYERSMLFEKVSRWPDKLTIIRTHKDAITFTLALQHDTDSLLSEKL